MKAIHLPTLIAALAFSAASASAATAINYDFNSDTIGNRPGSWFDGSNASFGSSVATLEVLADTNDYFGQGTSNRIVRYTESNTGDNGLAYVDFTPTVGSDFFTITFDYYTPTNASFNNGADTALGFEDFGNGDRRYTSTTAPIALDTLVTVSIIVNESGTARNYFNPVTGLTESLASGASVSFDFDHGSGIVTDRTSSGNLLPYGDVDKFGFKTSNSATSEFYFDDVVLHDNQLFVVPEPSAALLGGLGVLLLLRRRRA